MVFETLDRAIKLDPGDADAYRQRGLLHETLHQWPAALTDYWKVVTLSPLDGASYRNLARVVCAAQTAGTPCHMSLDPFANPDDLPHSINALAWALATRGGADPRARGRPLGRAGRETQRHETAGDPRHLGDGLRAGRSLPGRGRRLAGSRCAVA